MAGSFCATGLGAIISGCVYYTLADSSACTRIALLAFGIVALTCPTYERVHGAVGSSPWSDEAGAQWRQAHAGMHGVNVGGWLLLEKWLVDRGQHIDTPYELPAAAGALDERSLSIQLRANGLLGALDAWRDAYITRADFAAMRRAGLDAVRVPFGWWLVADSEAPDGFHRGAGLRHLDDALRWAEAEGLKVILDLHGAPGSQNGRQTAGHENPTSWRPEQFDADLAVKVLSVVAARYARSEALVGIALLNEPELPLRIAVPFYRRACEAVRAAGCEPSRVAVIINLYAMDALLRDSRALNRAMPAGSYPNVVFDVHVYFAFLPLWLHPLLSLRSLTTYAVRAQAMAVRLVGRPCIVGEWSLRLPFAGALGREADALSAESRHGLLRAFGALQLEAYSAQPGCVGAFYWTWHAPEHEDAWSLQRAVRNGWIETSHIQRLRGAAWAARGRAPTTS